MAKKKAAPARKCESCGKSYHPRKAACPHCGAANPRAGTKKSVKKKRVAKKKAKRQIASKKTSGSKDPLEAAIQFVEQAGGFKQAKDALATIEKIRSL